MESGLPSETEGIYTANRNLVVFITSLVFVFAGTVLYFIVGHLAGEPTYIAITTADGSHVTRFVQSGTTVLWSDLKQLGLGLIELGGVGIVFEWINRRAQDRLTKVIIAEAGRGLGESIAERTVKAVLGNPDFVRQGLKDDQRSHLIEQLIIANINDPRAAGLARRTAAQLSAAHLLTDYRVEYRACDAASENNSTQYAELRQRLTTTERPNGLFRYHFQVFKEEDIAKVTSEPDVYTWRYWLREGEEAERAAEVLRLFDVVRVTVNNVELTRRGKPQYTDTDVRFELEWDGQPAQTYTQEVVLRLPPPYSGGFVYFEPRALTRGMDVSCDYSESKYDVVRVETLRAESVELYQLPAVEPRIKGVRTHDWVLPTASVAFVFASQPEERTST